MEGHTEGADQEQHADDAHGDGGGGEGSDERWHPREREIPDDIRGEVAATDERDGKGYLYRPGELFVRVADLGTDAVMRVIRKYSLKLDHREGERVALLRMPTDSPDRERIPKIIDDLRKKPGAGDRNVVAGPNHVLFGAVHKIFGPALPPTPGTSWGALPPPNRSSGKPVTVAVLDTGVRDHAVFGGRVAVVPGPAGNEEGLNSPRHDEDGHGTFIAGVILRYAPGAKVRSVRLLSSWGHIDDRSLANAVRANADADIMSLSLGGYTDDDGGLWAFREALAAAWRANPFLLVVAAAGNAGVDRPFYPAAYPGVIGVAALDANGDRAPFSNFGSWVTACAPGVDVDSPFTQSLDASGGAPWACWSGTSFAAPYVAAAIAAEVDQLTPAPLVWLLKSLLNPKPGLGIEITTPSLAVP